MALSTALSLTPFNPPPFCVAVPFADQDGERSSYVDRGGAIEFSSVLGAASTFDDEDDCCIVSIGVNCKELPQHSM